MVFLTKRLVYYLADKERIKLKGWHAVDDQSLMLDEKRL